MIYSKAVFTFCAVLTCMASIAQQKQSNKKQTKTKPAPDKMRNKDRFNVAAFSEKRTLVQEKHRIPGTDSVVTETYYVWLLPG